MREEQPLARRCRLAYSERGARRIMSLRPVLICHLVPAALALVASSVRAQPAVPQLGAFALLGVQDVGLRRGAQVPNGAVGAVGGTVRLARDARVTGRLAAPMVRLARGSRTGPLFC